MEKTIETIAQKRGEASDQMMGVQCSNSMDMINPNQYDTEAETFLILNGLFVNYMMSIDRKWVLILTTLQKKDAPLKKEDTARIQDELKMPQEFKSVANHALYANLLGFTSGKAKGRVIPYSIELSFKGKNATTIVLQKAQVLRPKKGRHGR